MGMLQLEIFFKIQLHNHHYIQHDLVFVLEYCGLDIKQDVQEALSIQESQITMVEEILIIYQMF